MLLEQCELPLPHEATIDRDTFTPALSNSAREGGREGGREVGRGEGGREWGGERHCSD